MFNLLLFYPQLTSIGSYQFAGWQTWEDYLHEIPLYAATIHFPFLPTHQDPFLPPFQSNIFERMSEDSIYFLWTWSKMFQQ